jgi:hypothetical protein
MLMAALLGVGVPYEYLERMLKETPVEVLGLEPGWQPAATTLRDFPTMLHEAEGTP